MSASEKYVGKVYDGWISSYEGAQMKGAHAKPATVIASTARYDEICGGADRSVTTSPQKSEKTDVLVAMSMSIHHKTPWISPVSSVEMTEGKLRVHEVC